MPDFISSKNRSKHVYDIFPKKQKGKTMVDFLQKKMGTLRNISEEMMK